MLRMLLVLGLLPAAALAQVSGHGSAPSAGPGAQERTRPKRDDDPVVARIDRLRSDLADVAKRYRKAKAEERPALAGRMVPVLEEIGSLVAQLESEPSQGGVR
jgi:hypothetical protein